MAYIVSEDIKYQELDSTYITTCGYNGTPTQSASYSFCLSVTIYTLVYYSNEVAVKGERSQSVSDIYAKIKICSRYDFSMHCFRAAVVR